MLFTLARKLLFLWVRMEVKRADVDKLGLDPQKPVVYVLQYSSLSGRLVLEHTCLKHNLPSSHQALTFGEHSIRRSFFFLYERQGSWFRKKQVPTVTPRLKQLASEFDSNEDQDVQIVPVSLFWGRSPEQEKSWLQLLLTDRGGRVGRLRHLLTILLNGRRSLIQFSKPISLQEIYQTTDHDSSRTARKTARILRVHFRRVRNTVLGPNLSHRESLIEDLINSPRVKEAIENRVENDNVKAHQARKEARKYATELAANLQISTIHFLERVLGKLWNKIYRGISANNVDAVRDVTRDNAVIYVPCHRSHIDYLLLSYLLFKEGIMVPHIAAGINLNLPIVGGILRRGGAFFMRRSFKDNKLYAAIFAEYLHIIFKRGNSMEYFVEGGRSRTGRTLPPKAGMVAMTVSSYLRDQQKPIAFVPVYLGYEKVLEGSTYLGELRGKKKEKESVFGLFKSLKNLRKSFGKVAVNFGDPIYLKEFLDQTHPEWEENDQGERPDWLPKVVDQLSNEIVTRINASTSVNPINLAALCLLATQRQAMDAKVLARQMTFFAELIRSEPYSDYMTFVEGTGEDWIDYAEDMGLIARQSNSLGDIVTLKDREAILLTYNRNNILHLFAVPSLIATLIYNNSRIDREQVRSLFKGIYPYVKAELFLRWQKEEIEAIFDRWLDILAEKGLISIDGDTLISPEAGSSNFVKLSILARFILPNVQRYFITIAILNRHGSHSVDAKQLEEESTKMAERMSILFGLNAPEFFDKNLFHSFIYELMNEGLLKEDDEGKLEMDEKIPGFIDQANLVLNAELRQAILQVTALQ